MLISHCRKSKCSIRQPGHAVKNIILSVRPYWNIRDTLYAGDGIFFSDQCIVVPQSLQSQILSLIHESHFGTEKSNSRERELLY